MRHVLPCFVLVLAGCGRAAPVPHRASPRAIPAAPFVDGSTIVRVDPDHRAWAASTGDRLELRTPDGVVAAMPWASSRAWLFFDVAPDGTAALCTEQEVRVFEGSEEIRALDEIVDGGELSRCAGIVTRGGGDVWLALEPDPVLTFALPASEIPPPRLCHRELGVWRCRPLASTPSHGSLALTAEHVWWLASGDAFALETRSAEEPVVVASDLPGASLLPSPGDEAVLAVPWPGRPAGPPRLLGLDGILATFETGSDDDGFEDVWLDADGRVFALDSIRDGVSRCGPAVFSWGSSCTTAWHWTQLVVLELAIDADPSERGHVDYDGGGERAFAVQAPGGTLLSGDGWYLLPPAWR